MKIIKRLVEDIEEELEGAENYAKKATQYKLDDRALAETYANIASQELSHVDLLHAQVVRFIKDSKAAGEVPPAGMLDVWNYEHDRHIESISKIKMLLEMFKK